MSHTSLVRRLCVLSGYLWRLLVILPVLLVMQAGISWALSGRMQWPVLVTAAAVLVLLFLYAGWRAGRTRWAILVDATTTRLTTPIVLSTVGSLAFPTRWGRTNLMALVMLDIHEDGLAVRPGSPIRSYALPYAALTWDDVAGWQYMPATFRYSRMPGLLILRRVGEPLLFLPWGEPVGRGMPGVVPVMEALAGQLQGDGDFTNAVQQRARWKRIGRGER